MLGFFHLKSTCLILVLNLFALCYLFYFFKALVQCEQLKSEMERQKNRLEKELAAQLNKRTDEKEALREEIKKEREDLAAMV